MGLAPDCSAVSAMKGLVNENGSIIPGQALPDPVSTRTGFRIVEGIQASSDLPWRLLQTSHGAAIFIEPRDGTDSDFRLPVVCGDNQDLNPVDSEFLGNGILIQEAGNAGLRITSSLTALPPLYLYEDANCTVLSSSIDSIARLPCCSLHFDIQSVLGAGKNRQAD